MSPEETHTLSEQGKDAWNQWATGKLAEQRELIKNSEWKATTGTFGEIKGINAATEIWIESSKADFRNVEFSTPCNFREFVFPHDAMFHNAKFKAIAYFDRAVFYADAGFGGAEFYGDAWFDRADFQRIAWFGPTSFRNRALFSNTTFAGPARFVQCDFRSFATFRGASFIEAADFNGIQAQSTFSLERAVFRSVPDFRQAHFLEAPQLDDLVLRPRRLRDGSDRALPARYRSLRRLAIQGYDHELEHDFFAGEIKSRRFLTDFPFHWRIWSGRVWSGVTRWWLGWFYQIVSNFGRSVSRPLAFWLATIVVAAAFFLGQSPDVAAKRGPGVAAYATATWNAWDRNQPCYAGRTLKDGRPDAQLSGLAEAVREQTSAAVEAVHLALRNAFIVLDGGGDAAHRTLGCLYGVERYGENFIAVVPSVVSFASAVQKALSVIFIFLFGLAVRNLLRLK